MSRSCKLNVHVWSAGTIMSGSHADSIILGGAYDGILGVLGPIVAVKALRASGFTPRKSIEVAQFTSEEGDRFTEVCFGRCCPRGLNTHHMSAHGAYLHKAHLQARCTAYARMKHSILPMQLSHVACHALPLALAQARWSI